MFDLFDVKKKGKIYFDDFVRSLSIFHPNTPPEAKINCKLKTLIKSPFIVIDFYIFFPINVNIINC